MAYSKPLPAEELAIIFASAVNIDNPKPLTADELEIFWASAKDMILHRNDERPLMLQWMRERLRWYATVLELQRQVAKLELERLTWVRNLSQLKHRLDNAREDIHNWREKCLIAKEKP